MLKYVLFASATMMAAPAIAQQAAPPVQSAPETGAGVAGTAQAAQNEPAAQGANQPDQVAAILDSEFPTYDKDGSGTLNKAEFASWMDTLKTRADPAAKPDKAWNDAAFKKADKDKSASVSKTELASFLSSGTKAG